MFKIYKLTDSSGNYISSTPFENVPKNYKVEQGYFITKEDLRKRDKIFYDFGKESKDYERASAEVFEEMAIGFAGQELRKAIDKDIVEELSKKDK